MSLRNPNPIPAKTGQYWWCENCGSEPMSQQEMMTHIAVVHSVDITKKIKCRRELIRRAVEKGVASFMWKVDLPGVRLICHELVSVSKPKKPKRP